jgi:hypothetical protein
MSRRGNARVRRRRRERAREIVAREDPWDLVSAIGERCGLVNGSLIATYRNGRLVDLSPIERYYLYDGGTGEPMARGRGAFVEKPVASQLAC